MTKRAKDRCQSAINKKRQIASWKQKGHGAERGPQALVWEQGGCGPGQPAPSSVQTSQPGSARRWQGCAPPSNIGWWQPCVTLLQSHFFLPSKATLRCGTPDPLYVSHRGVTELRGDNSLSGIKKTSFKNVSVCNLNHKQLCVPQKRHVMYSCTISPFQRYHRIRAQKTR